MDSLTAMLVPGVPILEKIVRPIVIYVFLVFILRIGGRRELGQLSPFDLVVILTLSNTVQNAIIGEDNSVTGGIIGAATLVLTNLVVGRFFFRHQGLERRIEGTQVTLVRDGRVDRAALAHETITEGELLTAVHRAGLRSLDEVDTAILETSGAIFVFPKSNTTPDSGLAIIAERLARIESLIRRPTGQSSG
jgi:uncharacterized membrane protein YcaP (DUF421 family)